MFQQRATGSVVAIVVSLVFSTASCRQGDESSRSADGTTDKSAQAAVQSAAVTAFCGDCHAMPPPESFPQDAWFAEVEQGYRFYLESGRSDLHPPPSRDAVAYFRSRAPQNMTLPPLATPLTAAARFRKQALPVQSAAPAVSCLALAPQLGSGGFWLCDLHSGALSAVTWSDGIPAMKTIANLGHPAHVDIGDLDQDGRSDLLAADLGSFLPGDHDKGRVVWLPGAAEPDCQSCRPKVILDQIGRAADVRAADFDGDSDLDLVVAEFGWRKTGRIHLLLQSGQNADGPTYERRILDDRHGAIHVPVADLNQDGRPDIIALISQEHEVIEAFINQGEGAFERRRIFAANDPAFGFSGIELVDLDGDGDQDILATNGDTLDSHTLKPSHGVSWLENRGEFPFVPHRLAQLPGAMRAVPADLDGDVDLDIIAAAFLPATLHSQFSYDATETLVWLEQTQAGRFERHTLEVGAAGHMTILTADLDGDGDVDIAAPNYAEQRNVEQTPATIWWNQLRSAD